MLIAASAVITQEIAQRSFIKGEFIHTSFIKLMVNKTIPSFAFSRNTFTVNMQLCPNKGYFEH